MGMSWAASLISSGMANCMLRWVVQYEALRSPALGFLRLLLVFSNNSCPNECPDGR